MADSSLVRQLVNWSQLNQFSEAQQYYRRSAKWKRLTIFSKACLEELALNGLENAFFSRFYLNNSSRQICWLECVALNTIIESRLRLRLISAIVSINSNCLVQVNWALSSLFGRVFHLQNFASLLARQYFYVTRRSHVYAVSQRQINTFHPTGRTDHFPPIENFLCTIFILVRTFGECPSVCAQKYLCMSRI